jgi:hypothetical protein
LIPWKNQNQRLSRSSLKQSKREVSLSKK